MISDYVEFCNLKFKGLTKDIIFKEEANLKIIITCNAEFIVKANGNKRFKNIIDNNYTTFDGQIPYFLAKLINKKRKIEKLSGSDLIYDFCKYAKEYNKKIFLLGGYKENNKIAVEKLKRIYNIVIEGYAPPHFPYPFPPNVNAEILEKLNKFKPDILFVAFGVLKQEFWIEDHKDFLEKIGVKFAIGCGGTFDFVSGKVRRAPKFIQKFGLEGVWRFIMEPKWFRFKRILVSLGIFKYFFKSLFRKF